MRTSERNDEFAALATLLREERSQPDPGFAAELDRWAAAGFPRAQRPGAQRATGLRSRLALLPRRRVLATAGAALTLLLVVGVGVSQLETMDSDESQTGALGGLEGQSEAPTTTEDAGRQWRRA